MSKSLFQSPNNQHFYLYLNQISNYGKDEAALFCQQENKEYTDAQKNPTCDFIYGCQWLNISGSSYNNLLTEMARWKPMLTCYGHPGCTAWRVDSESQLATNDAPCIHFLPFLTHQSTPLDSTTHFSASVLIVCVHAHKYVCASFISCSKYSFCMLFKYPFFFLFTEY